MITRNGTDTLIGFIPGADIDEGTGATKGGLAKCPPALSKLYGWKGTPGLGSYTYPAGGASEAWDFLRAQGCTTPVSYRAFAIPNGYTIADVRAGKCDAIWTQRAKDMIAAGQGSVYYFPGYEGSDKNFNGSAGQVVPTTTLGGYQAKSGYVLGSANWAYAVNRQVNVMRKVAGWDCWFGVNYDVQMATDMGLDADPFHLITEPFQSIDTECYPLDDFRGGWSATTDPAKLFAYLTTRLAVQQAACKKYGVPLGLGETAPMLRTDTHASGDDPAFVQWLHDYAMDLKNNVAHLWLYNGVTGDTSRFALWDQASGTYTVNKAQFPKAAAAIGLLFDPVNFINRTATPPPVVTPPPVTYTQAQLDAAVKAQADKDAVIITGLQSELSAANAHSDDLAAKLANSQQALAASQSSLNAANTQITTIKTTWAKHMANMA